MARRKMGLPDPTTQELVYSAVPTGRKFHASSAFVRGIMGPVGSGKTVACVMEVYTRCLEQKPGPDGVRRSRWALIRNTYPELISTTMNTWRDWVPDVVCPITFSAPIRGNLHVGLPDGTTAEAEILFLALDSEEDVRKLKSLELTGAYINEASEIREAVLQMVTSRVNRYPPKRMGGPSWTGIIMDTNPPDDGHWWYRLAEVEKPKNYKFFRQPPALIRVEPPPDSNDPPYYVPNDGSRGVPAAENVDNQSAGYDYWMLQVHGKPFEWIKVFVLGEYGSIFSGKPVYPEYSDSQHCAKDPLEPFRGRSLILGWDFGLTPACIIIQESPNGQVRVLDELVSEDMGIERFSRDIVRPFLVEHYPGMRLVSVGDPAGRQRGQTDEVTCFQTLERQGFAVEAAPSNSFVFRRESVAWFLTKMSDGNPGFLMDKKCTVLRKGFMGGYQYRKVRARTGEKYTETPEKNEYSHIHDALQYACSYLRTATTKTESDDFFGPKKREVKVKSMSNWA